MTKVFIGGSRHILRINRDISARLENILKSDHTVLIGDANGVDKSVQTYFHQNKYEKVIVFCMGKICRNNIGHWETRNITSPRKTKDFSYYATKDLEMAKETDFGFMIWDGKSKGTLNNILNLLLESKKVLIYFTIDNNFYTLTNYEDLSEILKKCDKDSLQLFEEKLNLSHFLEKGKGQQTLTFA